MNATTLRVLPALCILVYIWIFFRGVLSSDFYQKYRLPSVLFYDPASSPLPPADILSRLLPAA